MSTRGNLTDPDRRQLTRRDIFSRIGAKRLWRRGRFLSAAFLVCLAALATFYVAGRPPTEPPPAAAALAPAFPPAPVSVVEIAPHDLPIYVQGIGAVQAFNAVTIKSRVDGELQQIFFQEGERVAEGALLAQIDPRPFEAQLKQAQAARDRDLALLETARLDFARSSELVSRGYTPRQTYDAQKNQVAQLEAAVRADDASIESIKLQLVYARIVSPLAGRTGVRLVDAGNIIHAGDAAGIVTIAQLQPISALFTLPQERLPEVTAAMRAGSLTVLAYSQDDRRQLGAGTLALIDNAIDQATGTIRLKAQFPNDDEALWPGQFINIRLQLSVRRDAIVVAAPAVQRNQDGTYAWVVKPDDTVEVRPIRVEATAAGEALVAAGLRPGERVVLDGQSRLRPGAKVVVRPSSGRNVAAAQSPEGRP
jgi:multidrug efflux system membrane fusion protein